jgi:hypothetical protein
MTKDIKRHQIKSSQVKPSQAKLYQTSLSSKQRHHTIQEVVSPESHVSSFQASIPIHDPSPMREPLSPVCSLESENRSSYGGLHAAPPRQATHDYAI